MHVFTKNHTFLIDICEKKIHGSLILLKNTKNILFSKYPYSDGMLFKKDFEKELQDFFFINTSEKEMVFFFTSVFANFSYDSFAILFLLDMLIRIRIFTKNFIFEFWSKIRDP